MSSTLERGTRSMVASGGQCSVSLCVARQGDIKERAKQISLQNTPYFLICSGYIYLQEDSCIQFFFAII